MSIINRHNYEEYFLLYIDNELSDVERQAVQDFIQQHPDLKIELDMLQQSMLHPDSEDVFENKDVLMKNSSLLVNETNYEEYFVLYADDELNDYHKSIVEKFVFRHPEYQVEFELIRQVRLQPDKRIVYPDKYLLYRSEQQDEKVSVFPWRRVAAAAMVFLFLSVVSWFIFPKDNPTQAIVNNRPEKKIDTAISQSAKSSQQIIAQSEPVGKSETNITEIAAPVHKKPVASNHRASLSTVQVKRSMKAAQHLLTNTQDDKNDVRGRNIQLAAAVTQESPQVTVGRIAASPELKKQIIDEPVGEVEINPDLYTASNDEFQILNTTVSKKNKLRGLIRKVTRVVEKTTSIEPGDHGRGIRIANLEIGLK